MSQVWLPLECNEPDLRLWSLNVIALLHSENEKMMEFGGTSMSARPNMDKDDQI